MVFGRGSRDSRNWDSAGSRGLVLLREMGEARFILDREKAKEQVKILEDLGLNVSYSYKTNHEVGNVLQEDCSNVDFSIHAFEEIDMIKDKDKISFFTQAESVDELVDIMDRGIKHFVVDNEEDLSSVLEAARKMNSALQNSAGKEAGGSRWKPVEAAKDRTVGLKIDLSIRMKFLEHRVGSGKYFVYGMPARRVNELIHELADNKLIGKLGVHIHRKSQNTSEWEIIEEIEDSLDEVSLKRLNELNLGGGLPSKYRSSTTNVYPYIFDKLRKTVSWLRERGIKTIIEPGRFIAAPAVKLEVEIIQIQERNIIVNTTIYNCALDNILTGTKMLVEGEGEKVQGAGDWGDFLIKGNSPTRDDIFRYKVRLENPKVGDKIVFLNAGAYNYTTDFFGYKKLKTVEESDSLLIGINRMNALGLKGTDKAYEKVLEGFDYEFVDTDNMNIEVDEKIIHDKAEEVFDRQSDSRTVGRSDSRTVGRSDGRVIGSVVPFFVGGDHSNLYPIGNAFREKYGADSSALIVFDAHADCMHPMKEPTHEEVIAGLVREGWKPENILLIGVRKIEPEEKKFMDDNSILTFSGKEDLNEIYKKAVRLFEGKRVYISIDVDVIDPKELPAVNYSEPKGLSSEYFFELFGKLRKDLDVRCFDLVELVPEKDVDGKSVDFARKVVRTVVGSW